MASWISRSVSRLRPGSGRDAGRPSDPIFDEKPEFRHSQLGVDAPKKEAKASSEGFRPPQRGTRDRLAATLRQAGEAMSPRMLRRTLEALHGIIDPRVSEVEGGRRAEALANLYHHATLGRRYDMWLLMSEQFMADADAARRAQARYAQALGTPDEAVAEVELRRATVSPRRRILQRFSAWSRGIPFLVAMRGDMQPFLRADRRLAALDVEMEYMFSTWFDVGFLDLRRISWDSPASLIEKLIRYEAVHDVRSWADMKNRLDSDRRCYGFFHPRLPDEPLIFVEVALLDDMAGSITPLLDESAAAADLQAAKTAIFYSISNTQTGMRGVSFGDSLIKRVVELLKAEFPHLRTFATLSPIPGFRAWLARQPQVLLEGLNERQLQDLGRAVGFEPPAPQHVLQALDRPLAMAPQSPLRRLLLRLAARYLMALDAAGKPVDPVARFHLGNGARIERLNWGADPSAKGTRQAYGLMVNYLYDLRRLDSNRALLAEGRVSVSGAIEALL